MLRSKGAGKWSSKEAASRRAEPAMPDGEAGEVQVAGLITVMGLAFSKHKNALFGAFHLAVAVAYMVRSEMCANGAIGAFWADVGLDIKKEIKKKSRNRVGFPTDQWVFRLFGSTSPEEIGKRCDLMLDAQMKVASGAGIMTEAVIDTIDAHNMAHYGKAKDKRLIRTKSKDGRTRSSRTRPCSPRPKATRTAPPPRGSSTRGQREAQSPSSSRAAPGGASTPWSRRSTSSSLR